jgi:D-3-phosphoglycerate dehydrogenase / 2-oxoglutarate reductase
MSADRKPKVVIADYDFGDADVERSIVTGAGFELVPAQCKSEDDVIRVAGDADAVITQYAEIGKRAIQSFTRCKVIARYGIGVDIVDVDAATLKNIVVTNVPNDWCMNEVADHAVALLLVLVRKLATYDRATRAGEWHWQSGRPIQRLQEGTLGLYSFGAIAKEITRRMRGFGVRIIAHDPFVDEREAASEGVSLVSFEELLAQSDYLMIQAPLTKATRGRFGEAELRRMKQGAILINTARGPIVKDADLYRVLKDGWLTGAGLDDLEEEPAKRVAWKANNPLFRLKNVIITPHAAYYSERSLQIVRHFASEEVVRVLRGETPLSPVNKVQGVNLKAA